MSAVEHGGLPETERAEFSSRGIELVDLSASLNPYGPHPRVVAAAQGAAFDRYPEADARSLRAAYATANGLELASVLAGNGSSELIYLAIRAFSRPGQAVLVSGPTFGEYAAAARAAGAGVVEVRAGPIAGFAPDLRALCAAIGARKPALTVVCNPNNPTGRLLDRVDIEILTDAALGTGGKLLVDEAYADFAFPRDERVPPAPGRLVLRSLTKLHAIPGLRLGFLLGAHEDVSPIAALQAPWAVSAPAIAAGLQALEETEFARASRKRVATVRGDLVARLASAGISVVTSHANFLLVECGDATDFRRRLLERGFVVRDCTSFGLPGHVRVAIPREELVESLATAMVACRQVP